MGGVEEKCLTRNVNKLIPYPSLTPRTTLQVMLGPISAFVNEYILELCLLYRTNSELTLSFRDSFVFFHLLTKSTQADLKRTMNPIERIKGRGFESPENKVTLLYRKPIKLSISRQLWKRCQMTQMFKGYDI